MWLNSEQDCDYLNFHTWWGVCAMATSWMKVLCTACVLLMIIVMWYSLMESIFPKAHNKVPIHILLIFLHSWVCVAMPLLFLMVLELHCLIFIPGEASCHLLCHTNWAIKPCGLSSGPTMPHTGLLFHPPREIFNSSKRNVTMLLFGGEHILSTKFNNTECAWPPVLWNLYHCMCHVKFEFCTWCSSNVQYPNGKNQ